LFGIWKDGKNNKAPHSKLGLTQLQIKELTFNPNHDVVKIKGASLYNSNEEVTKAREYGILMHYILSKIKSISDVDVVIEQAVLSGDLTKEEALKMAPSILSLLSLSTISPYFQNNVVVKNEFEILTNTGEILRPDRVVILDNTAVVIDYKTGKKNAQKYHGQMNDYETALLSLGYNNVKKYYYIFMSKKWSCFN